MRAFAIILGSFCLTWLVLRAVTQALELPIKHASYLMGPFNEPYEYWCSKSGIEYIWTQKTLTVHYNSDGVPFRCVPNY